MPRRNGTENINGSHLDLQADWVEERQGHRLSKILAQHASRYPWLLGIAAIVAIVVYPKPSASPAVQITGCICVALITVLSIWRQNINEHQGTDKSSRIHSDSL